MSKRLRKAGDFAQLTLGAVIYALGISLFFEANASALPKIMQFTTIRGIKSPRDLSRAGTNAFIRSSTQVTNPEIITMYAAIRTSLGINFLKSEIRRFERISTTVAEIPMPKPLTSDVDVASVGQVPRS